MDAASVMTVSCPMVESIAFKYTQEAEKFILFAFCFKNVINGVSCNSPIDFLE